MSVPDRLSRALAQGLVPLPESGRILLLGDGSGIVPEGLPRDRLEIVEGFRPAHDALKAAGFSVVTKIDGPFEAAILQIPRAKAAARLGFARAMAAVAPGAPVVADGQKTDGIDSLRKDVRARRPEADSFAKSHGRLFWLRADPEPFADWAGLAEGWPMVEGFHTAPGVFSADRVDPASRALAEALPERLPARVGDLGAGWGYLTAQILARPGVEEVHAVEADHTALEAARRNISDPRAQLHWADATRWRPDAPLDAVIMNPPFHTGRAAEPALGQAFIASAAASLAPRGTLWLVANRQLPYEAALGGLFRQCDTLPAPDGFKILRASQPLPRGAGAPQRHAREGARP